MNTGPTYRELGMARYLRGLDESHSVSLPDTISGLVRETLEWQAGVESDARRRAAYEAQKRSTTQAVLDTDVPLPKGSADCEVRVYRGSRDIRGGQCQMDATHLRVWETKEYSHLELDGQTVEYQPGVGNVIEAGWEIGKGFTKRPLTGEEEARAVRVYKTASHEAKLCGIHRKKKGTYGLPY